SDYWSGSLGEYGVGAGSARGVLILPGPAPEELDDSAMSTLVEQHAGGAPWPNPGPSTVFAFVFPATTRSTLFGARGCVDYVGYHSETMSQHIPYEVNLRCGSPIPGALPIEQLTFVLSHEAAEVATDPHPFTHQGWVNHTSPLGGEVGDLCIGLDARFAL